VLRRAARGLTHTVRVYIWGNVAVGSATYSPAYFDDFTVSATRNAPPPPPPPGPGPGPPPPPLPVPSKCKPPAAGQPVGLWGCSAANKKGQAWKHGATGTLELIVSEGCGLLEKSLLMRLFASCFREERSFAKTGSGQTHIGKLRIRSVVSRRKLCLHQISGDCSGKCLGLGDCSSAPRWKSSSVRFLVHFRATFSWNVSICQDRLGTEIEQAQQGRR
jgi:hypothetical protein